MISPPRLIQVLVVDDDDLLRMSFAALIDAQKDMVCVGVAADGIAGVSQVRRLEPDVVIMDIQMPNLDGIESTRQICGHHTATRVIMLTAFDLEANLFAALRAGASGFLAKDCLAEEVLHAIRVACRGESLIAPHLVGHLVRRAMLVSIDHDNPGKECIFSDLTDRERDLIALVARGLSNTEIAAELFLSHQTVKTYVSRVLAKVRCRDRAQLVVFAFHHGIT